MHGHWEICSCFLLEFKFLHIDQAQLECTGLNTRLSKARWYCPPYFWQVWHFVCQFCGTVCSLYWSFFPSTTQSVNFLLPYLNLLPVITSFSHICFPSPFMSTETLWSSVQVFPSPFSALPFLNIILDHVHTQHEMSSAGRKTQQLYWMCSSCLRLLDKKEIAISDR